MHELEVLKIPYDSPEWHNFRVSGIGGSEASIIMGFSKWATVYDLWCEKTGKKKLKSIIGDKAVEYGKKAEEYLMQLFALDYPQYTVLDTKDIVYRRSFMFGSLDAELLDNNTGEKGFLEIKTAEIRSALAKKEWEKGIPQKYYTQILHYFLVTGFDFAILKAQLKEYDKDGEPILITKHYRFNRLDCLEDMKLLCKEEIAFWNCVIDKRMPSVFIPALN